MQFLFVLKNWCGGVTDSGGVSEEATVLKRPCVTIRECTERPETAELGTNVLVGRDPTKLMDALNRMAKGKWHEGETPEKWDGRAACRLVNYLTEDILKISAV